MKAQYLLLLIFCLPGCSLFKKTSKNTVKDAYSLNRQAEVNILALKTASKETQIYSYWTDSTFYKYELIKEQVDEAQLLKEKTNEKQSAARQQTVKESKPAMGWVYISLGLFLVISCLLYKKILKILDKEFG